MFAVRAGDAALLVLLRHLGQRQLGAVEAGRVLVVRRAVAVAGDEEDLLCPLLPGLTQQASLAGASLDELREVDHVLLTQEAEARHDRKRIDVSRVVEVRVFPVDGVLARLLVQIGPDARRAEDVGAAVAGGGVARQRDARVEEVETCAHVLRADEAAVTVHAAVGEEDVTAPPRRGSQRSRVAGDRRVEERHLPEGAHDGGYREGEDAAEEHQPRRHEHALAWVGAPLARRTDEAGEEPAFLSHSSHPLSSPARPEPAVAAGPTRCARPARRPAHYARACRRRRSARR